MVARLSQGGGERGMEREGWRERETERATERQSEEERQRASRVGIRRRRLIASLTSTRFDRNNIAG